jgi:archaellum component FlaF (FlaF/FlaG flagellin family)
MPLSRLKLSRVRLLALMLVAVFAFSSTVAVSFAVSDSATTAAKKKKKSKKCKKGYKKVKGKCKKQKKKTAANPATSLTLKSGDIIAAGKLRLAGTFTTKLKFLGRKKIELKVTSSTGTQTINDTVNGSGTTNNFNILVKFKGNAPLTITGKIDGVSSNEIVVNN